MEFWYFLRAAEDRDRWKGIVATSFVAPRRPSVLRDWDEMRWVWEDLTIENLSAGVCELISRNGNSDGMVTFQDPLAWQRQFFRGQWKKQGGIRKGDRRRDGNWQKWRFDISWGQRNTGICGKVLFQRHLWCPDDRQCSGTETRWDEFGRI